MGHTRRGSTRMIKCQKPKKERRDAAADKEAQKAAKAAVRSATRTMAKTSSLIFTLDQLLADKHLKMAPSFAVEPAKKALKSLQKVPQSVGGLHSLSGCGAFDVGANEELGLEVKAGTDAVALLSKMLETARKHAG